MTDAQGLDFVLKEIAQLRQEIKRAGKSPWMVGTIVAANTAAQTSDVAVVAPGGGTVTIPGLPTMGTYIPEAGHQVIVLLSGAAPVVIPPAQTIVSAAPAVVTGVTASGAIGGLRVDWASITEADVKWNRGYYQVQVATDAGFTAIVRAIDIAATSCVVNGLTTGTTYYVRVRAVDYVGTTGTYSSTVTGVPIAVTTVDISGFVGIVSVGALPTLPSGTYPQGAIVFLTTDNKLYRSTGSAWTAAVPTTDLTGTVTGAQIAGTTITAANIANTTITAAQIANATITGTQVAATTLTGSNMVNDTITATQIAASAVTSSELAANAVVLGKVNAGAVDTAAIVAQAVTASQIANLTVTGAQIAATTIGAGKMIADTLTANEIAAGAITSSELAAGAVIAGKITAGTIVTGDIAALTITGANIAAATIAAGKLVANTITAGQIAAGTITTTEIAALTIVAGNIAANTITAAKIQAGTITGTEIAANTITTSKLIVTNFDNLASNPQLTANTTGVPHDLTPGSCSFSTSGGRSSTNCISVPDGAAGTALRLNGAVAATPNGHVAAAVGDQFYVECWAGRAVTGTAVDGVAVGFEFYNAAGTIIGSAAIGSVVAPTSSTYQLVTFSSSAAPAATAFVIPIVSRASGANTGATLVDDFYVRKMTAGEIIVDGTITGTKIAATTITAGNIAATTITGAKIAAATIAAGNMIADTLTANEIASNAITTNELNAGAVTAAKIATGTITANEIAASTITGAKIAANTITAGNITASTITSSELAANSVTASQLAAINIAVGKFIRSTTFTAGTTGWTIEADGSAEFNNLTVRGILAGANVDLLALTARGNGSQTTAGANSELMPNGGFDTNVTGWSATNATLTRVTTPVSAGTGAMQIQATAAGVVTVSTPTGTSGIPVNGSTILLLAAAMRAAATARQWNFALAFYTAAGAAIGSVGSPNAKLTDSTSAYTALTAGYSSTAAANAQWAAPGGAAFVGVTITSAASLAASEIHYLDVVSLLEVVKGVEVANNTEGQVTTRDTSVFSSSPASLKVLARTASTQSVNVSTPSQLNGVPAIPNQAYKWTFQLRGDSADRLVTPTAWYCDSSGGNTIFDWGEAVSLPALTLGWQSFSYVSRAPAQNAAYTWLSLSSAPLPDGGFFEVDDIQVQRIATVVGGYVEGDLVRSRGDVLDMTGLVMPPGSLIPWAGAISTNNVFAQSTTFAASGGYSPVAGVPPGWLICDGSAISRQTYWRLFSVIGTSWGAGNGTTTFNVPDFRGRVPVGLDDMGGSDAGRLSVANTLGGNGGEENHTLNILETPIHAHSINTTTIQGGLTQSGMAGTPTTTGTMNTGFQGGGGGHNNMPPYALVNYLIKC